MQRLSCAELPPPPLLACGASVPLTRSREARKEHVIDVAEKVVLDSDDMRRTLVRIAHEIVEKNAERERRASSASTAAARILATRLHQLVSDLLDAGRARSATSTSPSTATTSPRARSDPVVHASHLDFRDRGAHGRPRRRRALHRPHRARRDRGAVRLRPPRARAARRARRPRPPRAADPPRLRRQEPADRPRRARQRPRRGARRTSTRSPSPSPRRRRSHEASALDRGPRPATSIERILDRAESFAEVSEREIKKVPALRGRTVVNLFYEASTRTRSSFELAAKRLSADVVNSVRSAGSAVEKGESLKDTVQTLSAYDPAAIVIRSPHVGAAELVAGWTPAARRQRRRRQARAPDAGAARRLHAARTRSARSTGRTIWIVGDVAALARRPLEHPRASRKLGAEVTVCGPPTLIPRGIEALGCDVAYTLDAPRRGRRRLRAADAARAHDRDLRAVAARVRGALPDRRPPAAAAPAAHAPRPGQPRGRARRRGDRLAAGGDRRPGRRPASWCAWRCSTSCSPGAAGDASRRRRDARRPEPQPA